MKLRLAEKQDLNQIMNIINQAKISLKELGVNQWQGNYPNDNVIGKDIDNNSCYVIDDGKNILASFAISFDGDNDYEQIYDGNWSKKSKYSVVHRVAVAKKCHNSGLGSKVLDFAQDLAKKNGFDYIKIDTHQDNIPMQKVLFKNNFDLRGKINIADGSSRIVFDKLF